MNDPYSLADAAKFCRESVHGEVVFSDDACPIARPIRPMHAPGNQILEDENRRVLLSQWEQQANRQLAPYGLRMKWYTADTICVVRTP